MEEEYKGLEDILHQLRKEKGFSYEDLAGKMNTPRILAVTVKKWEKGLAYPELDDIYKLAEIYGANPNKILYYKQVSLQKGMNSVHRQLIKWISFILNVSFITAKWIFYIALTMLLILALANISALGKKAKEDKDRIRNLYAVVSLPQGIDGIVNRNK